MAINLPFNISPVKAKDALRLGIQSALSGLFTFLIMKYFGLPETFVGILSAVLVLDSSIGHTMGLAKQRLLSTFIGCVIGFVCVWLLPNSFGTAISLVVTMLFINGVSGFKPEWRYGVVAAVALSLGNESDAISASVDRLIAIALGVGVGIITSMIIWPDKANERAKRYLRRALNAACNRFEMAFSNTDTSDNKEDKNIANKFHVSLNAAKSSADSTHFSKTDSIKQAIDFTEKLYNSILIISRVANKSENNISDNDSGIKKDAEKTKKHACEIMRCLAKKKEVSDETLKKFTEMLEEVQTNINHSDDRRINTLRQTFIFGLTEIKENTTSLVETFKNLQ